jgi:hypothetical protein
VAFPVSEHVFGLAFDSTHVYFHLNASDGEVARAPMGGGPVETVVPATFGVGLEVDGGVVYWSTWGLDRQSGTVSRHELSTSLDSELFMGVRPSGIALDQSFVYWAAQDQSVWRAPREGGASRAERLVAPVGTLSNAPALLIVDDTHVYWVIRANLYGAPKGGGAATLLFNGVWAVTQDETALYFTTGDDGRVMKLAK